MLERDLYPRKSFVRLEFESPALLIAGILYRKEADVADIKTELARLYPPLPKCPPNYRFLTITELYQQYRVRLEGSCVTDPLGREVQFFAENFPHLVKLEFYNVKVSGWVAASAARAIEQLKASTFDESRYRIGDPSRPRTLFWVPDILQNPDNIYDNKRANGTEVYLKKYRRISGLPAIKVALVGGLPGGTRIPVTSFWCDDGYIAGCVKHPAKHPVTK